MSRPLVAIIPSYDRPAVLDRTIEQVRRLIAPDGLLVGEQTKGAPLGSGAARRTLCAAAVDGWGPEVVVLSLDDDMHLDERARGVRWAAEVLDEPGVGIVQLLAARRGEVADVQRHHAVLYHCYLLDGRMLAEGITYDRHDYADEIGLSLRAFFAGYRGVTSRRAYLPHHVTPRGRVAGMGGGREAAFRQGVPVVAVYPRTLREQGLIDYTVGYRDGVELPTPYASIRITPAGRAAHAEARRRRGWR